MSAAECLLWHVRVIQVPGGLRSGLDGLHDMNFDAAAPPHNGPLAAR